jgi:RNA recognition motif-containing protein
VHGPPLLSIFSLLLFSHTPLPPNSYVCNVPELATEAALISVFSLYGELESVRLIPTRHAVFANFTSVASAILARDELHGRPKPSTLLPVPVSPTAVTAGADSGALEGSVLDSGSHERPLHINFTTAQQNCMRARTGRTSWSYDERMGAGGGGGGGYAGRMGGSPPYGGRGGRFAPGPRPTGRSRGLAAAGFGYGDRYGDRYGGSYAGFAGRAAAGASAQPARSRGLYLGSLPISASLNELADLFEKYADIESMRLVRSPPGFLPPSLSTSARLPFLMCARTGRPVCPLEPCKYRL